MSKHDRNQAESALRRYSTRAPDEVPESITRLTQDELAELKASLSQLLEQIPDRIHYAESRRGMVVVVAAAVLAFAVALIPPILDKVSYPPLYWALLALCVGLVVTGLFVFWVFGRQTNFHYPFTEVTKAWKWFYRDALPDQSIMIAAPWLARDGPRGIEARKGAFTEQWPTFVAEQVRGLSNQKVSVYQDLQQVYILHVNEGYKNRFLTQLRSLFNRGMVAAFVVAIVVFVSVLAFRRPIAPVTLSSGIYDSPAMRIESSWAPTGLVRSAGVGGTESEVLVNLKVINKTDTLKEISKLLAADSAGLYLPSSPDSLSPPLKVRAKSWNTKAILLWLPTSSSLRLQRFEPVP